MRCGKSDGAGAQACESIDLRLPQDEKARCCKWNVRLGWCCISIGALSQSRRTRRDRLSSHKRSRQDTGSGKESRRRANDPRRICTIRGERSCPGCSSGSRCSASSRTAASIPRRQLPSRRKGYEVMPLARVSPLRFYWNSTGRRVTVSPNARALHVDRPTADLPDSTFAEPC
jgi:hypothetical protein